MWKRAGVEATRRGCRCDSVRACLRGGHCDDEHPMNVVLFSLVPLRADRLTCYGYYRDTTPAIDELAAEGVLFERTYATSPWTPPSHASTMTGQYPWNHGVRGDAPLVPSVRTMATHLRAAGMRTAAFVNTHHMGQ